jgi:uncharacterized cysteine cluster protein YcgN (CxxCxxCC family)
MENMMFSNHNPDKKEQIATRTPGPKTKPFFKKKSLNEMTLEQWESLCDHCGLCCLQKLEDESTGRIKYIGIACEFLDIEMCQCLAYENRHFANPDCIALTRENIRQIKWLPDTCAYRRLAEGRDLEWWHSLISGDSTTVHEAGISVRNKAVSGQFFNGRVVDIDIDV